MQESYNREYVGFFFPHFLYKRKIVKAITDISELWQPPLAYKVHTIDLSSILKSVLHGGSCFYHSLLFLIVR